jgi:aspartate/methionine/tyrosine aminotransferase
MPGGTGAYQDSRGNAYIRGEVAAFLARRDGVPADEDDIFLTDGASQGITLCLRALIRDERDGVLVPTPQYPLYAATITMLGGAQCPYPLAEDNGWALSVTGLDAAAAAARARGVTPRALVVINPGNPVGTCLPRANLAAIAGWCARERVVLIADEVYQDNVYGATPFVSFKRLACEEPAARALEVFSFHSVSKGFYGECGRRGAYFEAFRIHPAVKAELYKAMSLNLSTNVLGQVAVGVLVHPPRPGEPSYPRFKAESAGILASLARRACRLAAAFNAVEGVQCNVVDGAMYAFPRVTLPAGAVAAAHAQGVAPDVLFCLELLEHTNICVVPGSGFGQQPGTFHFRTTILPPEDDIDEVCARFAAFFRAFVAKYSAGATPSPAAGAAAKL